MTCEHCCGADKLFDRKTAEKQLLTYRKKGPKRATKKIVDFMNQSELSGKSLLDIGGGIGALQWNHLNRGGSQVTGIDASSGYLEVAQEFGTENNWEEQINYVFGDFIDVRDSIEVHDVVTLDKVVCCYPDYEELLLSAMDRCQDKLALSFPMDGWIPEFLQRIGRIYLKYVEKNDFQPYIHSIHSMHSLIQKNGFELESKAIVFPWHVRLYRRVS